MKKCPQCGRDYDLTMSFCLDDGAELLYGPATVDGSADEPVTAILSEPGAIATGFPASESPTRAKINTTDQTAVLRTGAEAEPQGSLGGLSSKTIEFEPNFWWAHTFLARTYEMSGKLPAAISELERARLVSEFP